MCGIFGTYSTQRAASLSQAITAANRMAHRGPDDSGHWRSPDNQVCLAHRRLSLVAIEDGHQPISNPDETIVAVVNGELYRHREIRRRLESRGHRFRSGCDSEIVVHLYQQHGMEFVDHLDGEFAFLLWDQTKQRLIAVRDRFGIKPLVYTIDSQRNISFASEAKSLLPEMQQVQWDLESFRWSASLQYLPPDRTLFEGIRMIPPGHFAVVDQNDFQIKKYWDLDYPHCEIATRNVADQESRESIAQTRELLTSALLERLDADRPFCFHLSGGLDSSSLLGIASQETRQRHTAFTLGFESDQYDETSIAKQTATFCGAELHVVRVNEDDLIDNLLSAAAASEGLAINGHLPAKFLLNQAISNAGFAAAITGEGADEAFLGYSHLCTDWYNSQNLSSNRIGDQQKLDSSQMTSLGMMSPHGDSLSVSAVSDRLGFVPTFLAAKATLGYRVSSLLKDELVASWRDRDPFAELMELADNSNQLENRTPIHQSAWLWIKLALSGYILRTLGDGTEMASSVEGRLPFLDKRLFEHCRGLSIKQLINGRTEKHILRESVRPYVTPQVYQRTKHPLDSPPILLNQSNRVREFLNDQIESDAFRSQPFFDSAKVKQIVDGLPEMNKLQRKLWDPALIMLCTTLGVQRLMSKSSLGATV